MSSSETSSSAWTPGPARILGWMALATLFTLGTIQFSFHHYRLLCPAMCDDVSYFLDGLDRLEEFHRRGLIGLLQSGWSHPPHSVFSSLVAAVSFGILGVHDWAPYAGNAVIIFVLIGFTDRLLHGTRSWIKVAALAFLAVLPMTQKMVYEFRPDLAVGLVLAMGIVMLLSSSAVASSFRRRLLIGLVFGVALLVKPTMFPYSTVLFVGSLGLAMLSDRLLEKPSWRTLFSRYAVIFLTILLVAIPYYAANGKGIMGYIYSTLAGRHSDVWKYHGSMTDHLLYYLTGAASKEMLDRYGILIAALGIVGMGFVIARRRQADLVRLAAYGVATLLAFAVPTLTQSKSGFYGTTFYLLAVFGAIGSLRLIFAAEEAQIRWPRRVIGIGVIGLSLLLLMLPPQRVSWGTPDDDRIGTLKRTFADILTTLDAQRTRGMPTVFVTREAQYVSVWSLNWYARAQGFPFRFTGPCLWSDLDQYRTAMEQAHFVLAFETEQPFRQFVSELCAPATLALARSHRDFVAVKSFPSFDGTVYHLFQNVAFTGWKALDGLDAEEGPYPQWNLPVLRWGTGPCTRLSIEARSEFPLRLGLSCLSRVPDQSLTVLLDGSPIFRHALPVDPKFTEFEIPLPPLQGNHEVTIQYAQWGTQLDARPLSVLYRRLQIRPSETRQSNLPAIRTTGGKHG